MRARIATTLGLVAALAVVLPLLPASSAQAIQGGSLDGEGHPNVAMVAWLDPVTQVRYRCTATLVSERVLLTAGHCTDSVVGKHVVTFASVAPPLTTPPGNTGFTPANAPAGYVTGTAVPHPQWTGKLRNKDLFDTGVIVLDQAVTGITPAPLAPRNYLDGFSVKELKSEPFTAVGYGVFFSRPATGPQKPTSVSDRTRRVAEAPLQNIVGLAIQLNESDSDSRFTGGTCFGDSGGPLFYRGLVVGDTSYGGSQFCEGMGGYQRIDDPRVWDWLQAQITAAA